MNKMDACRQHDPYKRKEVLRYHKPHSLQNEEKLITMNNLVIIKIHTETHTYQHTHQQAQTRTDTHTNIYT